MGLLSLQRVGALVEFFTGNSEALGEFPAFIGIVRNEFVQWRVQRADGDRITVHRGKGLLDVLFCKGEQLVKRGLAFFGRFGGDHFPQQEKRLFRVLAVEHVLGAEQADAFGAERPRARGVVRGFGIGAHADFFYRLAEVHEFHEIGIVLGGLLHGELCRGTRTLSCR